MFGYTNIRCIFPHGAAVANFPVKLATVKKPNPPTRSVAHRQESVFNKDNLTEQYWEQSFGYKPFANLINLLN